MKVDNLTQLQHCLQDPVGGKHIVLAAGIYEISQTLYITAPRLELSGECIDGSLRTVLKRGRLSDGSLFPGALLKGEGIAGLCVQNLRIEGGRREETEQGTLDHRHPLTGDKESEFYTCARPPRGENPRAGEDHYTPFETDFFFLRSGPIALRSLYFCDSIKFAIGFGDGVRQVCLEQVDIVGGGEGGIWCGLALLDAPLPLPLPEEVRCELPRDISMYRCRVEGCGGPGIYLEAVSVVLEKCLLQGNHVDYPHNHDGGQLEIPYKSEDILVRSCSILNAPALRRRTNVSDRQGTGKERKTQILRTVGIEAFGRRILLENNRIEGHAHEGILLNGASQVHVGGIESVIAGNHTAVSSFPELRHEPQQNISVTTLRGQAALGAVSGDITLEGIRCEHGVMFWSDGSVPDLRFHRIHIQNCDLRGTAGRGVLIGENAAGRSLQGDDWLVKHNLW